MRILRRRGRDVDRYAVAAQLLQPVIARIVAICDAFDTMTSHRPYRAGIPRDKALTIIGELRGAQFDSIYADAFITLGERGKLDRMMGHSDDGIPLQSCPMCGPTLVVRHEQRAGDHLYCRNCGNEFVLEQETTRLIAKPTGRKGGAADLAIETDNALIARTVHAAVAALPIAELLRTNRWMSRGDILVPNRPCTSHCPQRFNVAAVAGTILNAINQGDAMLAGNGISWILLSMNYLVPYCVASYSAANNELRRSDMND